MNNAADSASKDVRINMPTAWLLSVLALVSAWAAVWSSTRDQVARNTHSIAVLEAEAKTSREILIRIDENVKDLRQMRPASP